MIVIWNSLVFSIKMLGTRPLLSLLAILTMGTGIGISTSQIIIYQALMSPDLSFPNPEQIVTVGFHNKEVGKKSSEVHKNLLEYWQIHQTSFDSLTSHVEGTVNVYHQNRAIRYTGSTVNESFTDTIGVKPYLGEGFQKGDNDLMNTPKTILGYDIWKKDFAADPSIIGKDILVNSETSMVVGVMPKGFQFPFSSQIWIPSRTYPGKLAAFDPRPGVMVTGRIKTDVSIANASQELEVLTDEFFKTKPSNYQDIRPEDSSIIILPFIESATNSETRNILFLSTILVLLVLLVACANVTNLLLAGFSTRLKEIAVRGALGATRSEIGLQLLMESFLIAFGGAIVGLIYCLWAIDFGNQEFAKMEVPFWFHLSITPNAIYSAILLFLASGFLSGILPVFRVIRLKMNEILQDDSRNGSTMNTGVTTRTLVVMQISVSCALLIVTGMMMTEYEQLKGDHFSYDAKKVIGARLGLSENKYKTPYQKIEFAKSLLEELRSQPEVAEAAISSRLQSIYPSTHSTYMLETETEGTFSDTEYPAYSDDITNGFFQTLNLSMISGSDFGEGTFEDDSFRPVIVTPSFVDKHYPGQDVVGKHIKLAAHSFSLDPFPVSKIIGVAPETLPAKSIHKKLKDTFIYTPFYHFPTRFLTINVRPQKGYHPYSLVPLIKRSVAKVDKEIPLYYIETPHDSYQSQFKGTKFITNLFRLFSAIALFLSFVGIFGISSFSVVERIQEIGIRKSLGATGWDIFLLILKQGLIQLGLGVVLGIAGGLTLSYALKSQFPDMSLIEPTVYIAVFILLSVSSLTATFYPAKKAASISPAEATRVN